MERNQGVDVLSEACFPLLENSKFNGTVEKCQSAKLSDKILQKGSSSSTSNFTDSSFLNEKNLNLDHSFSNSVVSLNSSPHFNTNSYQQFEEKKQQLTKIPEHGSGQEQMRGSGVGRGKHRMKFSSTHDVEKDKASNFDSDVDKATNSVQLLEMKGGSVCNLEVHKMVKAVSDNVESGDKCDGTTDSDSCERLLQGNDSQLKDSEVKNVPNSAMERFREADSRRMQNGLDNVCKGYNKGKQFRLARFHNNNASPMQYGRPMPKQFALPQTLNALRTVKGNEVYYRHNEGRRYQPSKSPFCSDVDKIVHGKHRSQLCMEKDMAFDSNRNLSHSSNKSDMNNHLPVSEPFISRPVLPMFRRRSFGNKNDHVNNSKHWSANRLYSDSSTATVSCHNRIMVTSAKSVEPRHCGSCNVDKNGNNGSLPSKPESCDGGMSESSECLSPCNKEMYRLKANCSPSGVSNHNSGGVSSECLDSGNESMHLNTSPQASMQYPALGDNSNVDPGSTQRLPSESDTAEKGVVSGLSSCDSLSENLHSSHCKGQENVVLSKQAISHMETGLSPTNYGSSNRCSPFSMNAAHASYADIIRTPTVNHKVSVSSLFHSPGSSVTRTTENASMLMQEMLQKEAEQVSSSSEWIISRLSQVNASANLNGGGLHPQTASNHDGVLPRPIAVSLEKPSFYNSSLGIAKTLNSCVQQSSLSSPEKRMLECQIVEEHLCSMLSNKKTVDKISFLSELPAAVHSPGEQSNSVVCASSRTDSVFSDSSSVCSSTSSTFRAELQRQAIDLKRSTPPVIIMNNCMPTSNMSGISFGIEMDEIMQICSDTSKDSSDASTPQMQESALSKNPVNMSPTEIEEPSDASSTAEGGSNGMNVVTVGRKKLLWQDEADVSRCNIGQITDFLAESWLHVEQALLNADEECTVRYYSEE